MPDELRDLSSRAIHQAAELLGVDPFRLARFLGNGVIADLLQSTGVADGSPDRVETLAKDFQAFLQQERARAREVAAEARTTRDGK